MRLSKRKEEFKVNTWKFYWANFDSDKINSNLAVSPWSGHRRFGYDLIANLRPSRIVELGTHYGCSFFSFLQSCKDNNLNTQVIAIDTLKGDEQAGFYSDEVWDVVNNTLETYYSKQNYKLLRMYFKDALKEIEDESIDILHIDGLHTYEAVSEDYFSWLPKLKRDGIVLFHDIASELNYGTNKFWDEIKEKIPENYTFEHSWGLGVLLPKDNKMFSYFEEINLKEKILIYEYRAKYELVNTQLKDHIRMVEDRDKAIKANEKMINEKDKYHKILEDMIKERDKVIKHSEKMIDDREHYNKSLEKMIDDRDEAIKANEKMIDEREHYNKSLEKMIDERDRAIKANEKMIIEIQQYNKLLEDMVDERNKKIRENEEKILNINSYVKKIEQNQFESNECIKQLKCNIAILEEKNYENNQALVSMDIKINAQEKIIFEMNSIIENQKEVIVKKNEEIEKIYKRNFFERLINKGVNMED